LQIQEGLESHKIDQAEKLETLQEEVDTVSLNTDPTAV